MQLDFSTTDVVIFLVFIVAFLVFSIAPAIWISEKIINKFNIEIQYSNKIIFFFTIFISFLASFFLYS